MLRLARPWLFLLSAAAAGASPTPAPPAPVVSPVVAEARQAQGDYTTLRRLLAGLPPESAARRDLLGYLAQEARREPPLDHVRAALGGDAAVAPDGAQVPRPAAKAWQLLMAGERNLARHRLALEDIRAVPGDTSAARAALDPGYLQAAREALAELRAAPSGPPEAFALAAALEEWNPSSPPGARAQLLVQGMTAPEASSGLILALTDRLAQDYARFGARGPPRGVFLRAYRRALERDRGWSRRDREACRLRLAGHLLLDQIAGRRGTEREWAEGLATLRALVAEAPEHTEARANLAYAYGIVGNRAAAWAALDAAPDPAPFAHMRASLRHLVRFEAGVSGVRATPSGVVFHLPAEADDGAKAWVTGDFDRWEGGRYLAQRRGDKWVVEVPLPPGTYRYSWIVGTAHRLDLSGAPTWIDGRAAFERRADGALAAIDPVARARVLCKHLASQLTFPVAKQAAATLVRTAPTSTEALEAFWSVYQQAGLAGLAATDYAALSPEAGHRAPGAEYLTMLAGDDIPGPEAFAAGGPLAALHGDTRLALAITAAATPAEKVAAFAEYRDRAQEPLTWPGDLYPLLKTPGGRAALVAASQGSPRYLEGRAEVLSLLQKRSETHAEEVVAALEDALAASHPGDGAQAWFRRLWRDSYAMDRCRCPQETVLRALEAHPHAPELLRLVEDGIHHWEDLAQVLARLGSPPPWPESSPARLRLRARLQKELRRFPEALASLDAAEPLAPGAADLAHYRGCVLIQQGQINPGLQALRAARRAGDRSVHVLETLVETLLNQGRVDELLRMIDEEDLLEELRPGRVRSTFLVVSVAFRQRRGEPTAVLMPLLREGLKSIDDLGDPQGTIRLSGHLMLLGFGAELGDEAAFRQATSFLGSHQTFQATLGAGLGLLLALVGGLLGLLLLALRRRPVLRSFFTTPLVWSFCLVVQMLAAAGFGLAIFGNAAVGLFAPKTEAGAMALMVGYGVMAFPIAGYALLEFWLQGLTAEDLGLNRGPDRRDLWAGFLTWLRLLAANVVVLGALALVVQYFAAEVSGAVAGGDTLPGGTQQASQQASGALGIYFQTILLAPLMEELFFRGYVYGTWRKKLGPWPAALASALFFGAIHFQSILPIFIAGVFFARAYERSGTLWVPVLAHVFMNGVAIWLRAHGVAP